MQWLFKVNGQQREGLWYLYSEIIEPSVRSKKEIDARDIGNPMRIPDI